MAPMPTPLASLSITKGLEKLAMSRTKVDDMASLSLLKASVAAMVQINLFFFN